MFCSGRPRTARHRPTQSSPVDGELLQVRTTRSGTKVSPHGGRDLDAVVRADASIVLGLAAGVLTLDDSPGLVDIDGDEAAVRAVRPAKRTGWRLGASMTTRGATPRHRAACCDGDVVDPVCCERSLPSHRLLWNRRRIRTPE